MSDRVVIVGGTSGIGLATARHLLAAGHHVVVTGRSPERLATALKELGEGATGEVVDARDEAATRAFFRGLGTVGHVVVTATGRTGQGPFRTLPPDDIRQGVEGKLMAQTVTAQAALDSLRPDGSLTFVTAASAGAAIPGTAGLAAINGAVEAMVPVLAVELAPLRVNAVSPGVIETGWWDGMDQATREAFFASFAAGAPAGRVGRPEDVASAIGFLVENSYTTGMVVRVDGGVRLAPPAG